MSSLYLSPDEMSELTGLTQGAAQIRWLQKNGIRHFVRADGKPRVPRRAVTEEADSSSASLDLQPNFDAVRVGH